MSGSYLVDSGYTEIFLPEYLLIIRAIRAILNANDNFGFGIYEFMNFGIGTNVV